MVPQLVVCHKCGIILYEGIELKHLDEIIQSHDGKCPNCGRKLSYIPKNIEVKPVEETNQRSPLETEYKRPSKSRSETRKRERKWNAHASYEPRSGSIWKN